MSRNDLLVLMMTLISGASYGAPAFLPNIKQELMEEFRPCNLYQPETKGDFDSLPGEKKESFSRLCYKCPKEVALEFVEEFSDKQVTRLQHSIYVMEGNTAIDRAVPIAAAFIGKHSCKKDTKDSVKTKSYVTDFFYCKGFRLKQSVGMERGAKSFTLEVRLK